MGAFVLLPKLLVLSLGLVEAVVVEPAAVVFESVMLGVKLVVVEMEFNL